MKPFFSLRELLVGCVSVRANVILQVFSPHLFADPLESNRALEFGRRVHPTTIRSHLPLRTTVIPALRQSLSWRRKILRQMGRVPRGRAKLVRLQVAMTRGPLRDLRQGRGYAQRALCQIRTRTLRNV